MTRSKGQTKAKKNKGMRKIDTQHEDDGRFIDLAKNPMFREQRRKERKVVVDDRFKQMLSDKRFEERDFRVDKRGKPIRKKNDNFLSHLYEFGDEDKKQGDNSEKPDALEEEDDDDEFEEEDEDDDEEETSTIEEELPAIQLDLARGEGPTVSSSSEDEEETEDEYAEQIGDGTDELLETEKGIQRVEWASSRLAICNMDWGKLTAEDLMQVLHSFKPAGGSLHSVSVYLSDFGAERLDEEKRKGPKLKLPRKGTAGNLEDQTRLAIRAYEADRLRYFYAICQCDNTDTATRIYEACDGVEYEASGIRFDLRFVPDNMKFEVNRLRDEITSDALDPARYKPKRVTTHSLVSSNPKITWEETDPERRLKMQHAFEKEAKLDEFESLVAPCSDEEDDECQKSRYNVLIGAANEAMEEKGKILAGVDAKEVVEEEDEEEMAEGGGKDEAYSGAEEGRNETESDSEDGEDGPGVKKKTKFQVYLEKKRNLKVERKQKEKEKRKAVKRRRFEGDLDDKAPKDGKVAELVEGDERFGAFFKDSNFAIDRTHSQFKGGDLAKRQVYGKMRRSRDTDRPEDEVKQVSKEGMEEERGRGPGKEERTETLVERLRKKQKQRRKEGMIE